MAFICTVAIYSMGEISSFLFICFAKKISISITVCLLFLFLFLFFIFLLFNMLIVLYMLIHLRVDSLDYLHVIKYIISMYIIQLNRTVVCNAAVIYVMSYYIF